MKRFVYVLALAMAALLVLGSCLYETGTNLKNNENTPSKTDKDTGELPSDKDDNKNSDEGGQTDGSNNGNTDNEGSGNGSTDNEGSDGESDDSINSGTGSEEETDKDDPDETDEYIWEKNTPVYVVSADAEYQDKEYSLVYGSAISEIYTRMAFSNDNTKFISDKKAPERHEIIFGRADRDISRKAYELLEKEGFGKYDVGYLVYSDGYSVAIAYMNGPEDMALNSAIEYFKSELLGESLKLDCGVVKFERFLMTEIWQERDDRAVAEAWQMLENRIALELSDNENIDDSEVYAAEMIAALKSVYSLYSDDLVMWFAGLYEPYICICDGECQKTRYCGGAGFYYSNSARDNDYTVRDGVEYKLLPDAETTAQVFGFLHNSGILRGVSYDIFKAFPEGEPERIVRFIKALQDETTGYFYHPQWLSMLGTAAYWDSRQSRDLNYSLSVLSSLGAKPTYNTPSGIFGDGILYDGTKLNASAVSLTMPLSESRVLMVSKAILAGSVNPRLESEESFKQYLSTLNLAGNSYYVGNELSSMAPQIVARDSEIATAENPRPLATILDSWLRENQDPETGHWDRYNSSNVYYATNGLLKIAALYNTLKMPFPNPLPAARTAFRIITSEEPISHVCDLYNTWFIISCVTGNLKKYSGDSELAAAIIDEVRLDAIPAVIATAEKMKIHLKEDGSFSYFKDKSSQNSQGAPVAIPNTNEGDVNATVIFTYGIVGYMFDALGFGSTIPMYTECDRLAFVDALEEKINACEYRKADN